jgi:hypothetical protein
LFARAFAVQCDTMRGEDFWERLKGRLPLRREFTGEGGHHDYSVLFSRVGEDLFVEKQGRSVRLGPDDVGKVWHRFVEWWCLPSRTAEDVRAGLDFGDELGGDAGFYAFELACLMNEMEHHRAFGGRR